MVILGNGTVKIIPNENFTGVEIIEFIISDPFEEVRWIVEIVVDPVNDAPYAVEIIAESAYLEGGEQVVSSLASDIDDEILIFTWISNLTGEIGSGQTINLSLSAGYHAVTLIVIDSEGLFSTATKNIEIISKDIVSPIINTTDDKNESDKDVPIGVLIAGLTAVVMIIMIGFYFVIRANKKGKEETEPQLDEISEDTTAISDENVEGEISSPSMEEETIPESPYTEPMEGPLTTPQEDVFGDYELPQDQVEPPIEPPSEEITEPLVDIHTEEVTEPLEEEETQIS